MHVGIADQGAEGEAADELDEVGVAASAPRTRAMLRALAFLYLSRG